MGKYTGKMIISDLDGTLIPRGGVISAENRQAIADLQRRAGCLPWLRGARRRRRQVMWKDFPSMRPPCSLTEPCSTIGRRRRCSKPCRLRRGIRIIFGLHLPSVLWQNFPKPVSRSIRRRTARSSRRQLMTTRACRMSITDMSIRSLATLRIR